VLFSIDESDPRPLYEQIASQVKSAVAEGRLAPGEVLPGVRELAGGLGINLHTGHKAYQRLRDAGVIELHLGRRARVAVRGRASDKRKVMRAIARRIEDAATDAALLGISRGEFNRIVERAGAGKLREPAP
jgi:GntR family transcriptional regulator